MKYMKAKLFDYIRFYNKERGYTFLGNILTVEFKKREEKLVLN